MFQNRNSRAGAFGRNAALAATLALSGCASVSRDDTYADNREVTGTQATSYEIYKTVAKAMGEFENEGTFRGAEPKRVKVAYLQRNYKGTDPAKGLLLVEELCGSFETALVKAKQGGDYKIAKGEDGNFAIVEADEARKAALRSAFNIEVVSDAANTGELVSSERSARGANANDRKLDTVLQGADYFVMPKLMEKIQTTNHAQSGAYVCTVDVVDINGKLVTKVEFKTQLSTTSGKFRQAP